MCPLEIHMLNCIVIVFGDRAFQKIVNKLNEVVRV